MAGSVYAPENNVATQRRLTHVQMFARSANRFCSFERRSSTRRQHEQLEYPCRYGDYFYDAVDREA